MIKASEVRDTLRDCMFDDHGGDALVKIPADAIKVEGIMNTFMFDPKRVAGNREKINDMLDQLPDEFHLGKGGGMSFLQACMDRDGNHWGEHINMDELFVIGQAIGRVKYLLPREVWSALPGSMPYLVVGERA